jgi:hypothetical protein
MAICDDPAPMECTSETFIWKTIAGLRPARNGDSRKLSTMAQSARVPCRAGTYGANDPAGDQAEVQALREEVDSICAQLEHLTNLVSMVQPGYESDPKHPAANVQTAATARERASERVDEAASHLVRAASNKADRRCAWDRTDEAVANLLFALSKQAGFEWERLSARCAGANRLRLAQQFVKAEKERRAIRKFWMRCWWRLAVR